MKRTVMEVTKENEHEVPAEVLQFRDDILNWETAKDLIKICLMRRQEENERNIAKKPFLDMDQYIRVVENGYSCAVSENLIKSWGLDVDTAFELAKDNTEYEVIAVDEIIPIFDMRDDNLMYVASTPSGFNGASAMCSNEVLDEMRSQLGTDKIIIIPSSVHEIIGIAYHDDGPSSDDLKQMIQDLNHNVLEERDILSNNAYIYDGCECMIM